VEEQALHDVEADAVHIRNEHPGHDQRLPGLGQAEFMRLLNPSYSAL